jgi:hypothetical protein
MCKCIERVDAKLAEYNAACETNLVANPPRAMISLYKVKPRGAKPPLMEASYCPFCGKEYPKRRELAKRAA